MAKTIFVDHEPGTYKAYYTVGGWAVMFLDEQGNSRGVDGDKVYAHRQNAYRRAKQLNDSIQKPKREWMYNTVDLEDITATDLRAEAMKCEGEVQCVHIYLRGHAECAHALYLPDIQRMGIAWGADATWADVDDIEQGIEMWVNHPEEWISRN